MSLPDLVGHQKPANGWVRPPAPTGWRRWCFSPGRPASESKDLHSGWHSSSCASGVSWSPAAVPGLSAGCRPRPFGPALVRADPPPQGGRSGQAVDEAAEALAEIMDERRRQPLYAAPDGMASHPMASVRLLHRRAALTSVEGGRRVFIVGEADRLVPQESSQEAANALLKLLEEPPAGSLFVLTTMDPRRVLPTIRSRAVPVRLQRLSDDEVRTFLRGRQELSRSAAELDERVRLAEGSIGEALAVGEGAGTAYRAAGELLEAVAEGQGAMLERALRQRAVRRPRRVRGHARRAGRHAGRGRARSAGSAGPPAGAAGADSGRDARSGCSGDRAGRRGARGGVRAT